MMLKNWLDAEVPEVFEAEDVEADRLPYGVDREVALSHMYRLGHSGSRYLAA